MLPLALALMLGIRSPIDSLRPGLPPSGPTSYCTVDSLLTEARHPSFPDYLNPNLLRDPPPRPAIRAVIAHELSRILDCSGRSASGLARFTFHYLTRDDAAYERAADLAALGRGYGCGPMAYRERLYGRVPPPAAAAKRRTYLTPVEIRNWLTTGSPPPEASRGLE